MSAYFFSDVHLGLGSKEDERIKEDRLLTFLEALKGKATHLFIVGDLFDFWFEYQTVIPKGFHRTLAVLDQISSSGTELHYLHGNHDCWMGDFFEKELGANVHAKPFEVTLQKQRIYLHHGDGLANNDLGYRIVKPILRSKFNIWLYRWLHPDIGVRLARGTSRSSREYTTHKHYGEESSMIEYAKAKFLGGFDIVIMGHRHFPNFLKLDEGGTYVNLGDWISHNSYASMTDGVITLKTWNGVL